MITEPTVLILGAGASKPYGFPLGGELKDTILERLANYMVRMTYLCSGFSNEQVMEFEKILQISPYDTIDAILTFHPSIAKIGKFAIAETLSACQKHDCIFPPKDWYHYLFRRLELENALVSPPPLTILTFNYDNSFEYFFETIISEIYESQYHDIVKKNYEAIRIIHLHGRIGLFPSPEDDPLEHLSRCIRQSDIRVISDEALDKAKEFTDAYGALSSASRIVFLGFGYADSNLRRLRLDDTCSKAKIFGTCQGENPDIIKKTIGREIHLCNNQYSCLDALKEWKEII